MKLRLYKVTKSDVCIRPFSFTYMKFGTVHECIEILTIHNSFSVFPSEVQLVYSITGVHNTKTKTILGMLLSMHTSISQNGN